MLKPEQQLQLETLMTSLDREKVERLTSEPYFHQYFQIKRSFTISGEAVAAFGNTVFDKEGSLAKSGPDFFSAAASTILAMREVFFKNGYTQEELTAAELWAEIYISSVSAFAPRK